MKKETKQDVNELPLVGYRVKWELKGEPSGSCIMSTQSAALSEAAAWLEIGCKVTIAPATRSPLFKTN